MDSDWRCNPCCIEFKYLCGGHECNPSMVFNASTIDYYSDDKSNTTLYGFKLWGFDYER